MERCPTYLEASALGDLEAVRGVGGWRPGLVNAFAADGFYPLGLAAFFGYREIVEFLLKNGADVEDLGSECAKVTALHGAVARRDVEIVKMLLEAGADRMPGRSAGLRRCMTRLPTETRHWSNCC